MNPLLKNFRRELQSRLLEFLWEQWSALGVSGQKGPASQSVADPEALLLFSCTLARHDPRLFDEVIDWLHANGRLINVARLRGILKTETFAGEEVLSAVASLFAKGTDAPKWKELAGRAKNKTLPQTLFFEESGKPLPVLGDGEPVFSRHGFARGPLRLRHYSKPFPPADPATLVFQLRALLGITVRCEIIAYLFTHEAAHASQIARETYFFERAVQNALADMSRSGIVQVRLGGRTKHYWLDQQAWTSLLNRGNNGAAHWVTWPPLLSALEKIWLKLSDPAILALKPLLQSSELRQLILDARPALERGGFDRKLSDDRQHLGEAYLPVFINDVRKLLDATAP